MNVTKDYLKQCLRANNVSVTFTKKDGTERKMLCTLKENAIPTLERKTERVKAESPDVLAVFDLENQAWRSFRLDSITNVEISNENQNV